MLCESFDLCSPSMVAANILRPSWVALACSFHDSSMFLLLGVVRKTTSHAVVNVGFPEQVYCIVISAETSMGHEPDCDSVGLLLTLAVALVL